MSKEPDRGPDRDACLRVSLSADQSAQLRRVIEVAFLHIGEIAEEERESADSPISNLHLLSWGCVLAGVLRQIRIADNADSRHEPWSCDLILTDSQEWASIAALGFALRHLKEVQVLTSVADTIDVLASLVVLFGENEDDRELLEGVGFVPLASRGPTPIEE